MMFLLLVSSALAISAVPKRVFSFQKTAIAKDTAPVFDDFLIEQVNKANLTWRASKNQGGFFNKLTVKEAKVLMGARFDANEKFLEEKEYEKIDVNALPKSFDSRVNWPHCPTIKRIRDQSACGSCWAFSAVEAMSDRECIAGGHRNLSLSAAEMNSCCHSCGYGCGGGFPPAAWRYWVNHGLVNTACSPYTLPSCDHHIPNSKNPCPKKEYKTPACRRTCVNNLPWNLYKGKTAYEITTGEAAIMAELVKHGPVQTAFTVYQDFLSYKGGVYKHTWGGVLGGHAVKIIGYGVENGVKYWLVANSWNADWGLNGFFKIVRGVNECGFENQISAGLPH